MIEPRVTAVSGRRYLALLIDSAIVAAVGFLVAYLMSEKFAIVGRDDAGDPLVDPAQFGRMEEMLDFEIFGRSEILGINLVRAQEIGDSVRVFGSDSYWWGLLAAALASLIVFYTIPAIAQRTIGMLPFGLEIRDIDGGRATLSAHVKRSIAGVVDMIPGIVPGLVGTVVASFSTHQQRIGDRLAGTVVVDRKLASFYVREQHAEPLTLAVGREIVPTAVGAVAETTTTEDHDNSTSLVDPPVTSLSEEPESGMVGFDPTPPAPSDTRPAATETQPPPTADRTEDAPLPPPPVHRKPPSEQPRPTEHGRRSVEPGAAHPAPVSAEPQPVDEEGVESASIDDAWKPPRVEPAPVWQPAPLDPAPAETPRPDDARTLDEVLAGRPKVGELISADPVTADRAAESGSASRASDDAEQEPGSNKAPVWSDKWRAWMYWDPKNKRWLRHDTATNSWIPAD